MLHETSSEVARPDNGDVARQMASLLPTVDLAREKGSTHNQSNNPVDKPEHDPETRCILRSLGQKRQRQEQKDDDRPGGGHPGQVHHKVGKRLLVIEPK